MKGILVGKPLRTVSPNHVGKAPNVGFIRQTELVLNLGIEFGTISVEHCLTPHDLFPPKAERRLGHARKSKDSRKSASRI